jgi:hypothetical protein
MRLIERIDRIPTPGFSNDLTETDDEVDGQLSINPQDLEECNQIELCQMHPGEKMSFYCHEHSAILCEECKNTVHRWGCNVVTVTSQASDEAITEKVSDIEQQFLDINNKLDKTERAMVNDITVVKEKISDFKCRMMTIRGELDQLLNEMQQTLTSDKFCDENLETYSKCQESKIIECHSLKEAMKFSKSEMETIMKYGKPEQRFIAAEQLLRLMPMFVKAADDNEKSAMRIELRHEGIEILHSVLRMRKYMNNMEGLHVKLEN